MTNVQTKFEELVKITERLQQANAERAMLVRCVELLEDLEPGHDHRTLISETVREARRVLRGKVD